MVFFKFYYQPFKKKQIAVYSVRASFPHTLLFVSLRNCDSVGFIMPKTVFVCGVAQPGNKMASSQGSETTPSSVNYSSYWLSTHNLILWHCILTQNVKTRQQWDSPRPAVECRARFQVHLPRRMRRCLMLSLTVRHELYYRLWLWLFSVHGVLRPEAENFIHFDVIFH